MTDNTSRRGIQSIEIGLRVVKALRDADGALSLKEIAAAARISASNCHRYLVSWTREEYVRQDPLTGRYDLGAGFISAGLTALSRLDPIGVATESLIRLVDATGHTGLLAIWNDPHVVIVRWVAGRSAVRTTLSAGALLPLSGSATGRVLLAHLPERQTARALAAERKAGAPDVASFIAAARASGIAEVSGEHIPGLSAASAPVRDSHGEAVAALTLVALSQGFAPGALDALREEARAASISLGWSGGSPALTN